MGSAGTNEVLAGVDLTAGDHVFNTWYVAQGRLGFVWCVYVCARQAEGCWIYVSHDAGLSHTA